MQRDMDLIRELLLRIEKDVDLQGVMYNFQFENGKLRVDGYDDVEVYKHLVMLLESPFIEGQRFGSGEIAIKRLTWPGRDFLDSVRDDGIWAKTKQGALAAGGFSFDLLKDLAKGFIKKQIEERTGIQL